MGLAIWVRPADLFRVLRQSVAMVGVGGGLFFLGVVGLSGRVPTTPPPAADIQPSQPTTVADGEIVSQAVSSVTSLMQTFLAALAVIVTIAAALGFRDLRQVREEAKQVLAPAREAADRASKARQDAETTLDRIRTLEGEGERRLRALLLSTKRIGAFQQLGEIDAQKVLDDQPWLVHGVDRSRPPAHLSWIEDIDTMLLAREAVGSLDTVGESRGEIARALMLVGRYWLTFDDYGRAKARLERALEFDSENPQVQLLMAKALAWSDAEADRKETLDEALVHLGLAQTLAEGKSRELLWDIAHAQAWIYDEKGEYDRAIQSYENARALGKELGGGEKLRNVTYNLACSLVKAGRPDAALAELADIAHCDRNWEKIARDPDFAPLREPPFAQAYGHLLEVASQRGDSEC